VRFVALLLLLAFASPSSGLPRIVDPADPGCRLAVEELVDWITFHAGFEDGVTADLAVGSPEPVIVGGAANFRVGLAGKAIRLGSDAGGANLAYSLAANLDLSRPGTLSFWVAPMGWNEPGQPGSRYLRLISIVDKGRTIFLAQRDTRRRDSERIIVGFYHLPGPDRYLIARTRTPWSQETWHLIAVSWDATGFAVSLDGGSFVRRSVPNDLIVAPLTDPDSAALVVGSRGSESTLLDDLTIYGRVLGDADVAAIWRSWGSEGRPCLSAMARDRAASSSSSSCRR